MNKLKSNIQFEMNFGLSNELHLGFQLIKTSEFDRSIRFLQFTDQIDIDLIN